MVTLQSALTIEFQCLATVRAERETCAIFLAGDSPKTSRHYHAANRGSNSIPLACVPLTIPLAHVPAWKSELLRVLRIKYKLPLLCQKCTISGQACCRLHNNLSDKE